MNVDIAFGGSYVVEVTLGDGEVRNIYFDMQYLHIKIVPCTKGGLW
jgi:hypothetical protein